ncbi:O-methyltransferase [Mycena pura]|uniref:O-methyltransferase n=1 Tax=Mycena pura TaxID=153505 RepID=A0AAD6VBG3_9AGAR|nr:O-methyltransferase [Mycena pura]
MASSGLQTLRRLAEIINQSLDTMERGYARAGIPVPSLDVPFDPAETACHDVEVATARLNIMAATAQMFASVCSPTETIWNASQVFHISSGVRVASELNVAEILREAGPQGLHVKYIAAPSKVDPTLLARILRLLATHHIFREVTPDVFANNRISSALDKAKPSADLFANREDRLQGTSGVAAVVELYADEVFKSSAVLAETLLDPKEGVLPYNKAFGTDEPLFYNWMQRPENAYRRQRFGIGMQGTDVGEAPGAIFAGFDWGALPAGSVLVDVGSGTGHISMQIAQKHTTLRVVNQDLEDTIEDARRLWKDQFPSHIETNMVDFQVHNFLDSQPVKNAAVFLVRHVVHNWPDDSAVKILQNLREAAQPSTRLVIMEMVPDVAARSSSVTNTTPASAARPRAPEPLLPNWGVGSPLPYYIDMAAHALMGGGERTLGHWIEILTRSNWKLDRLHYVGSPMFHIVASPTSV